MAEYIEREKLKQRLELSIKSWGRDSNSNAQAMVRAYQDVLSRVQSIPKADVVEVVHAEWKVDEFLKYNKKFITCSHCESTIDCSKGYIDENEYDYCPYCSAKMDGKDGGSGE